MAIVHARNSASGMLLAAKIRDENIEIPFTFNWGIRTPEDYDEKNILPQYANSVYCGKNLNGLEQLQHMADSNVLVPQFTSNIQEAIAWVNQGLSVWGRKLHHTQGKDIKRSNQQGWTDSDFWVVQIPPTAIIGEWRLHTFNGKSIARGKKTQVEAVARRLAPFVRSRRNGWRLDHAEEPPKGARFYAKEACQATKYLWGAADMLQVDIEQLTDAHVRNRPKALERLRRQQINPFVVLEVNQQPGMDDYTCSQYVKAMEKFSRGA